MMKPFSHVYQLLIAHVVLCVVGVKSIRVSYGTNDGPISPPPPSTTPEPPRPPYREPAPVWEENREDNIDPNAHWRPPLFIPQIRYTQIIYNLPLAPIQPPPQTSAQRFVSQYLPRKQQPEPTPVEKEILKSEQKLYTNVVPQLSSQKVPGVGIRYFIPYYENKEVNDVKRNDQEKHNDAKYNQLDNNDILEDKREESGNDYNLKADKESRKRQARASLEGSYSHNTNYYSWPVLSYNHRYW